MDKVFQEKDLTPITHEEFNKFIKGKGFIGGNNYKLRDLKAMFGFKPMITGSPLMISSDEMKPMRFDSCQRLHFLQEYHTLLFYTLRRILGIEFALMEKNIQ